MDAKFTGSQVVSDCRALGFDNFYISKVLNLWSQVSAKYSHGSQFQSNFKSFGPMALGLIQQQGLKSSVSLSISGFGFYPNFEGLGS